MPLMGQPTREASLGARLRVGESDALRKHLLGVEAAMVAYARQLRRGRGALGRDRPRPRPRLRALPRPRRHENGHPRTALRLFEEMGWPQELIDAVAGHAVFLGRAARDR